MCAVGQQSPLLLWRDQQLWDQAAAEAPRRWHAEERDCCGEKCRLRTERGKQTAGPGHGELRPGPGAEAGKQMTGFELGSGQIRPVKPGADGGPGTGLGAQCEAEGLSSQVQAERPEGRNWSLLVPLHSEWEGRSRSAVCPLGLSEAEKPQHTGQTSQCGCPDQRLNGSAVGCLSRW